MKNIDKQIGVLLFDRILETTENKSLKPKEKIPKYRSILDDLFKALTIDAKQYISGLNARSIYIFNEYETPKNIVDNTHALRKFANQVVHETEFQPTELDDKKSVYQLAEVISHFSKETIPVKIKEYYQSSIDDITKKTSFTRPILPTYDFYAVIEDVFIPFGEIEGKFCVLTCNTDSLGVIKLKLWNNKNENGFGSDLSGFGKIVEPYQNIYVTNVKQYKDKEDEFYTTDKSYVVLEPDYLIDAKELSECRQFNNKSFGKYEDNPLLYILNRFTKGEITDRIMVGNIVGKMLDDLVTDDNYNYKSSFETVMRENSFGMLCIANEKGSYDRSKIQATFIEANDHEKQLKQIIQSYKGKEIILEPTFISNKYGLQGRLDMLIDYGSESHQKDIIELKSSKNYPGTNIGLYLNHEAQTMCYDLLISSTYPDRIGYNSILYSSAPIEEKPLRNVDAGEKYLSKQELLMLRNRIVSSELKLARGIYEPFFEILSESFGPYPKFLEDLVVEFKSTIENLDKTLKAYFFGFLRFIYRELQVAKIGSNDSYNKSNGYAELWKASKSDKIENYDVLIYLKVKEISDDFHIKLTLDKNIFSSVVNVSSFRVGDTAILYPTPNPDEINPLKSQILKCYVVSVDANSIEISLINKQLNKNYFTNSEYWALDRDLRETGYKQLLQLLYEFVKSEKRVTDLVLGLSRPQFVSSIEIPNNGLDEVQFENVKNAVRAKDYYLIQGPPGTGKTSKVLVEIVRNLANPENDIMVVAFTNRAVDEICEKLLNLNINCIRLGKGDKPYYWSALSGRLKLDELNEVVKKNNVFVSTISTFANSLDILKFKKFETLIIDEASQVLEPQIIGFLKHFKKWILIGDENQLPAVVVQSINDSKCDDSVLNDLSLKNFRESLFYRLKKNAIKKLWNDCYGTLKFQYRMHADIAEFPKQEFYKNILEESNDSQRAKILDYSHFDTNPINQLFTKSRIVFVPSKVDLHSKINIEEAVLVAEIIKHLANMYGDNFDPYKTVGVITPFRAQIANIKNHLDDKYQDITIDTVERFQGSERKIIIVSFAVKSTTQLGTIQSLNDENVDRKLNVAITRAKDYLILIGSEEVLIKDKTFKRLIEFVKDKNGYFLNPLKVKTIPTNLF